MYVKLIVRLKRTHCQILYCGTERVYYNFITASFKRDLNTIYGELYAIKA